jgi:REP element-mobilizing transposase RayT
MKYSMDLRHRRSIRLRNYDYANAGAYFVTVCLNQRIPEWQRNVGQTQHDIAGQTLWQIGQTLRRIGQTHRSAPTDFPTFGTVENGVMVLNDAGKMVEKYILEIVNNADKFFNIKINEYIIMPDHIHAIIINEPTANIVGADLCVCPHETCGCPHEANTHTVELGTIIQWFKTMTTTKYIDGVKQKNWIHFSKKLWQRNYWEHIIRNEAEYSKITEYIRGNPVLWGRQCLNEILPQQ